jgi:hypothetical protein
MATVKRRGPGRDTTSAKAISVAERHAEWLKLRKQGKPYREIAREAGVAVSVVHEAVAKQVRAVRAEPAADLLAFEVEANDALIERAYAEFEGASEVEQRLAIVEQLRKLRADRRKMLGLDAPQKVEVSAPRETLWERVRGWLNDPTPELEQVLAGCGWQRKGKR